MQSWIALVCLGSLAAGARPENMVANPSAERAAENRMPQGWGLYVGAGSVKLTVTTEEKHSGQSSACLELTGWYVPKGVKDAVAARYVRWQVTSVLPGRSPNVGGQSMEFFVAGQTEPQPRGIGVDAVATAAGRRKRR